MSSWRQFFSYNKYAQITARAVRASLNDAERLAAEKRGLTELKYQKWEGGVGGAQVLLNPGKEDATAKKS